MSVAGRPGPAACVETTRPGRPDCRWRPRARAHGDYQFIYNRHTSVPHHLDWILQKIGYTWPGDPVFGYARWTGTIVASFSAASLRVCEYACDRTSNCAAFDYSLTSQACTLHSTPGGLIYAPNTLAATR